MNSFKTRSSAKKNILTTIITFIPMFALAFLGLKIAVITWLFFEGILLLTFCFLLLLVSKTHWEIEFKGDRILLYNTGNRQSYIFEQLQQSDFHIRQSKKQKIKNTCDMKLSDAPFVFSDVEAYEEMQTYIQNNFPA